MNEILRKIQKIGIVPVIRIDDEDQAVPLAKALYDGGLPLAEITFRTAAAAGAIRKIAKALPDMLLGAGTIMTREQVDQSIDAGASFMVSAGFNPAIASYAISKEFPVAPGTATPGEMEQAMALGLDTVKFFPAELNGGIAKLKALSGPYPNLMFMPTGGVSLKNMNDYLSFNRVLACGGTWLATPEDIRAGNWDKITALSREAVQTMLGYELVHVGIHTQDPGSTKELTSVLNLLFGFIPKNTSKGTMVGPVELLDVPARGAKGHLAIGTNSVLRAIWHLENLGISTDPDTIQLDAAGQPKFVNLKQEIAGFSIHLINKS